MRQKKHSPTKDGAPYSLTVALAGNPNVGKSTLFNSLTGAHAHTGNWAGKTVGLECGALCEKKDILIVDIPGTYSLYSHSEEEKIARDYICFGCADLTVVVCDACALRQNLNLVIQILETGRDLIVAVNLMDEAQRRGITVDTDALSEALGVTVIPTVAHDKSTLSCLACALCSPTKSDYSLRYPEKIESAIESVSNVVSKYESSPKFARWIAARLIDSDTEMRESIFEHLRLDDTGACEISAAIYDARVSLSANGITGEAYRDEMARCAVCEADRIATDAIKAEKGEKKSIDSTLDKIFTGKYTAYPVMLALLALVFFATLSLANYPSAWLSLFFSYTEGLLFDLFVTLSFPVWLTEMLLFGLYRTLGQVVAVMLPPMLIFFPLFALLEDSGYLPRVAYNLDRPFCCAGACGKQALTMCMGLGCNAVGIVGARIIDSGRERTLAILTNSLVPCNGRLPMLLTLISAFYIFITGGAPSLLLAATLTGLVMLSVLTTFLATFILSRTVLKGERSSFTIELPPYRRPRFLSVIFRSITDKCGSILLREAEVAAPIGVVIWLLANISIGDESIISYVASALDPIGKTFGLDGAILLSFILGIPANEIVIPILMLIYSSASSVGAEIGNASIAATLSSAGWTPITVVCTTVFALFHWPCSTSLITVYKETRSIRLTLMAFAVPTVIGLSICFIIAFFARIFI